jgi:hypothetical protein
VNGSTSDASEDARDLQTALHQLGVTVEVRDEVVALTASADGGVLFALVLAAPMAYLSRLGFLFADETHDKVRQLLDRYVHSRGHELIFKEDVTGASGQPGIALRTDLLVGPVHS